MTLKTSHNHHSTPDHVMKHSTNCGSWLIYRTKTRSVQHWPYFLSYWISTESHAPLKPVHHTRGCDQVSLHTCRLNSANAIGPIIVYTMLSDVSWHGLYMSYVIRCLIRSRVIFLSVFRRCWRMHDKHSSVYWLQQLSSSIRRACDPWMRRSIGPRLMGIRVALSIVTLFINITRQ